MNRERYQEIVGGFVGRAVVVLGDLMMDEYLWGRATRISPESPVMVVEVERETRVPGGAANVVNNLLALGAKVAVIGVVGEDEAGAALTGALREHGADVSGIVADPSRPTTRKTRIVAHSQQVLRVDREQTHPVSEAIAERVLAHLRREIERPRVEDMLDPQRTQISLLRRTRGGKHHGTARMGPLNRSQADASRGRMDQDFLTRLQARCRKGQMCSTESRRQRRGLDECQPGRHFD